MKNVLGAGPVPDGDKMRPHPAELLLAAEVDQLSRYAVKLRHRYSLKL
jgi:hypothetical protein